MNLKVLINGTVNSAFPEGWGLRIVPFPLIAKAEYAAADKQLRELSAPGQNENTIRATLSGFDPRFVDTIVETYQPGQIVMLEIEIPDRVLDGPRWSG